MRRTPQSYFTSRPLVVCAAVLAASLATSFAAEKNKGSNAQELEAATRLQVFLDRANFGPGKLDGHFGDFTLKALALYRQSRGEQPTASPPSVKAGDTPDISGLDLSSVDPVFISYKVTDADLQNVGALPDDVAAKAELKALPYASAAEALAEKFHCDIDFLEALNPGKSKTLKAGDEVRVPNVEPFEIASVKDLKAGSEINPAAANASEDADANSDNEQHTAKAEHTGAAPKAVIMVRVDTKTNMLAVLDGDNVMAAYPVSIGSEQTASPVGDWKVRGIAKLPTFRWDEKMLTEGERSSKFKMLPPGPNNPAGVMWIALNKSGIGLHGTDDPDAVGRAASHGCIRLANWDIVRLAGKVKAGTPVSIQ
jgi:lipoprotein-anchoring transpeptidase ErfK/SrfK